MNVGIFGGNGRMGTAFASFFKNLGFQVFIADKGSKYSNIEVAKLAEVLIVAVPIDKTENVIKEINPYVRKKALLMDVTSIKEQPVKAMLKSKAAVIGMHPMFNETTFGFGQKILYSPARPGKWLPWFLDVFGEKGGFKLIKISPKKHDQIMAFAQTLVHFTDFALAKTLSRLGPNLSELLSLASPASCLRVKIAARHLAQDAKLYGNIQFQNLQNRAVLKIFEEEVQELFRIVTKHDLGRFIAYFNQGKKYFGNYGKMAIKETDVLIQRMIGVGKLPTAQPLPKKAIATLGPSLTYSSFAALKWKGKKGNFVVYFNSIEEIFEAVESGKVLYGVVPLENRLQGTIRETHDCLFKHRVYLVDELRLDIHHCLAVLPGVDLKHIQQIVSHPQALNQCSLYLRKYFPKAEWITVSSTAAAFEYIRQAGDEGMAAIGSKEAAKHFKFKIAGRAIENDSSNVTDFIVISSEKPKAQPFRKAKTSLVFYFQENKPGSLFAVFEVFADLGINLSRIESRPAPKELGEYLFFVDIEENADSKKGRMALNEVRKIVSGLKILGIVTLPPGGHRPPSS